MKDTHQIRNISVVTFGSECMQLIYDMRWMILLSMTLVVVDFWFGCRESIAKGTPLRKSKAGRRTLNKFVDYLCYLVVGGLLGKAMEPIGVKPMAVATTVMILTYIFEIMSIYGHVAYLHGFSYKISPKAMLVALLKKKDSDLAEAVDESVTENKNREDDESK